MIQLSLNCKSQYRRLNSFCRVLRCDFLLLISVKLKLLLSETLSLFKSNKQPYHRKYSLNWQTAITSYEKINPKLSLFKLNPTTIYIRIQILHIGNGIFGLFRDRLERLKLVSAIFYQIFIYHQKIALQKIWKMFFISSKKALFVLEILKFSSSRLFHPVSHCFSNLKVYDAINCISKNLITHFAWYLKKEIGCDIEILSIVRVSNKEHFYGKIMQKMCTKS